MGFKGCEVEPRLVGTSELQREKRHEDQGPQKQQGKRRLRRRKRERRGEGGSTPAQAGWWWLGWMGQDGKGVLGIVMYCNIGESAAHNLR
ncbi:predicted protein [Histoplasma mississippiense (nom. inval.)]|uniref:predicted protein n=1 Tax=Ajellomyces capsulatus (strain NAm1 / WU24) TaxID=2059318 RepID=UPI000157C5EF|nr:predicted protein [Histoplasma mississippiense (nom. inval.)]EDN08309.1 predicted protein [Histoplasma mississippiense (nom. inval.)]